MEDLVKHLVTPLVSNPDDVSVKTVEGDAVTIVELSVHADDRKVFEDDDFTLRAVRNVMSAAAGSRKATVELVGDGEDAGEE